jgi:hypothetical protein
MPTGENARRGLTAPARVAVDAAGYALGLVLAAVAALRRRKGVHPRGAVYDAELLVNEDGNIVPGTDIFAPGARHRAIVRFSRSLGLPPNLPDLLGMAVRIPHAYGEERHQDFLMVTSVDAPVAHHFFVPVTDPQGRPYSSGLPYRAGETKLLVGALPRRDSPRPDGDDPLDRLAKAAATGTLSFDLAVAGIWGRFRPVGELRVGAPLPPETDALRFNPWNCGGGIEPTGLINRLRDYAYPLSQRTWRRTGKAREQDAAEALTRS